MKPKVTTLHILSYEKKKPQKYSRSNIKFILSSTRDFTIKSIGKSIYQQTLYGDRQLVCSNGKVTSNIYTFSKMRTKWYNKQNPAVVTQNKYFS